MAGWEWGGCEEMGCEEPGGYTSASPTISAIDLTCMYQASKQSGQYYDKCEQNPFADGCDPK